MEQDIAKVIKRSNHLNGEIEAVYHEMSLKLGLSDSASLILYTILDNGTSCLLQDICRRSGLSKQTVNSAIRKLEAEGTVYLTAMGAKNKNVCLTEEGVRFARRTAGKILEAENKVFASWSQEDVEKYLQLTEMFLQQMKQQAKEIEGEDAI